MKTHTLRSSRAVRFLTLLLVMTSRIEAQSPQPLSDAQRQDFSQRLGQLQADIAKVHAQPNASDADIFAKGLRWALKYDKDFSTADLALLEKALKRGIERQVNLADKSAAWDKRRGKLALGYVSRVDGSVQPYGLIVPKQYDPQQPFRLDVVLHGSTRPVGMSELRFMARFDEGDAENAAPPDHPYIELHPLGRVENCYRWAGETDVFEAIEDVCRRFNIDRNRIVLRGMSMGASGTWHLGLKHPDRFAALGPYCGYVDTHHFSETPIPNFVKIGALPEHQELGLHMLDSVDYAANASVVPAIACMGEKDIFFQAHVLMGEAMRREGLSMINLISPGTGHVIDPKTQAEQLRQIAEHVANTPRRPRELRFVTWTLKYNRCHWLEVLGLQQHYVRAELAATLKDDVLRIAEPQNITRFAIITSQLPVVPTSLQVGQQQLAWPTATTATQDARVVLSRRNGQWQLEAANLETSVNSKQPGLQGPIDDAFTTPFLCVRGTGQPWNKAAANYAAASLQRFADEWQHYFRGDLPIKDDTAVTDDDIKTRNLILFGDPGSNALIAKTLPQLPLQWTAKSWHLAGHEYASADHVPALIAPNPLPGAKGRYVVLNSGHTFRESELAKLNYLLFPHWGDWAALRMTVKDAVLEDVVRAGYFNEAWR